MPKFVTLVVSMLETCFWCLSPGFWVWEIHWDRFQTPQIGHFWSFLANSASHNAINMPKLVLSMLET